MRPFNNDKGYALVFAIIVLLIGVMFVTVVLTMANQEVQVQTVLDNTTSAIHVAEAGLNQALARLNDAGTIDLAFNTPIRYGNGFFMLEPIETTRTIIRLKVTGWMDRNPAERRSVLAVINKRQFTQNVYLSNFDGTSITFGDRDNIFGRFHTNGTLRTSGNAEFFRETTASQGWRLNGGPRFYFYNNNLPRASVTMDFPEDNASLNRYSVDSLDPSLNTRFVGTTYIFFDGSNGMVIRHGNEDFTRRVGIPEEGLVVFVGGSVDRNAGGDPVFRPNSPNKFNPGFGNVFVSGTIDGRVTIGCTNNIYITYADPTNHNFSNAQPTNGIRYQDVNFDLNYNEGDTDYGMIVNTTDSETTSDMLGLIAGNSVFTNMYGWPNSTNAYNTTPAIKGDGAMTIHAAVFALTGSIANESCYGGTQRPTTRRNLSVRGSLIQESRGIVVLWNVNGGFDKDYAHDPRLETDTPPFFLEPTNSGWQIVEWVEVEP